MKMEKNKKQIIDIFEANVKGQIPDLSGYNKNHHGAEGHWLEKKMGIAPNNDNKADLLGYEMKKPTAKITSYGDWCPDVALWNKTKRNKSKPYPEISVLHRDNEFLKYFGQPNPKKNNRLSWSGRPVPKVGSYNEFGQILRVDADDNIVAYYSFSKDPRPNKGALIPTALCREDLILAKWTKGWLLTKLENKFNDIGWFKCYKNNAGQYTEIGFGNPFTYSEWIGLVKRGIVYFDSAMTEGNSRQYAMWRANNSHWESLIIEKY